MIRANYTGIVRALRRAYVQGSKEAAAGRTHKDGGPAAAQRLADDLLVGVSDHDVYLIASGHATLKWDADSSAIVIVMTPEAAPAPPRPAPSISYGADPKTTDYCVVCGESPDSGAHLFGHDYVDPRFS